MKISRRFFLALTAALMMAGIARAASAQVGRPAPDFTLTDITGRSHSLSDFKGKTVVLEWTNPECPIVGKHYRSGNMPKTQQAALADGVVWLQINSGHPGSEGDFDPGEVVAWQRKYGAASTAYFRDRDGKVGHLYDARTTPHMFIIDAGGTLVYAGGIDSIRSGRVDDIPRATNYVATALAEIKAGKPVTTKNSQPYGCAVKYGD
jgi:hypothetical protein